MKSEKQLSIFGKQKSTKVLQIFAFQKIASVIDAEAPKGSFASITDAIGPDCWTHYNNEQPLKEISINDITILLSQETKSFSYLLQKNEKSREDIIQATKRFYLDEKMTNLFD